ncbi:MAG: hypothetical protein SFW65_05400 [Alphaproteobacteria bacterium]|nr:hypothetical protein [Alphaproteobacteria bacterium]
MSAANNTIKTVIITAIVVAVVLVGAYVLMQPPRPKTLGERIDAAAEEISKGMDKAAGSFDDRSPAQKAADDAAQAAKEFGDKAKAAFDKK